LDNELVRAVVMLAGLVTHSRLAPGGNRAGTANGALALTTTVGVIAGVHNRTANGGTPTHVALAAGLTDVHVLVIHVANLADGSDAVQRDVAHLAGGQTNQSVAVLFRHQLSHVAGAAHQLAALTGVQ